MGQLLGNTSRFLHILPYIRSIDISHVYAYSSEPVVPPAGIEPARPVTGRGF